MVDSDKFFKGKLSTIPTELIHSQQEDRKSPEFPQKEIMLTPNYINQNSLKKIVLTKNQASKVKHSKYGQWTTQHSFLESETPNNL